MSTHPISGISLVFSYEVTVRWQIKETKTCILHLACKIFGDILNPEMRALSPSYISSYRLYFYSQLSVRWMPLRPATHVYLEIWQSYRESAKRSKVEAGTNSRCLFLISKVSVKREITVLTKFVLYLVKMGQTVSVMWAVLFSDQD